MIESRGSRLIVGRRGKDAVILVRKGVGRGERDDADRVDVVALVRPEHVAPIT